MELERTLGVRLYRPTGVCVWSTTTEAWTSATAKALGDGSLADIMYGNIQRWTRMPRGGHFPSLEAPEALAEEIRAFFRPLRGNAS